MIRRSSQARAPSAKLAHGNAACAAGSCARPAAAAIARDRERDRPAAGPSNARQGALGTAMGGVRRVVSMSALPLGADDASAGVGSGDEGGEGLEELDELDEEADEAPSGAPAAGRRSVHSASANNLAVVAAAAAAASAAELSHLPELAAQAEAAARIERKKGAPPPLAAALALTRRAAVSPCGRRHSPGASRTHTRSASAALVFCDANAAPGSPAAAAGVPWSEDEHRLFLLGLQKLGKVRARRRDVPCRSIRFPDSSGGWCEQHGLAGRGRRSCALERAARG